MFKWRACKTASQQKRNWVGELQRLRLSTRLALKHGQAQTRIILGITALVRQHRSLRGYAFYRKKRVPLVHLEGTLLLEVKDLNRFRTSPIDLSQCWWCCHQSRYSQKLHCHWICSSRTWQKCQCSYQSCTWHPS